MRTFIATATYFCFRLLVCFPYSRGPQMGRRNVLVRRFEITRASQAYIDITTKILVLERPA